MANIYKRLAALRPANTNEAKLYGPTTGKSAIVNLVICNQGATDVTYKAAITATDTTAADEEWIAYNTNVIPNVSYTVTGICLIYPNTIRVVSGASNQVSFVVHGLEIS